MLSSKAFIALLFTQDVHIDAVLKHAVPVPASRQKAGLSQPPSIAGVDVTGEACRWVRKDFLCLAGLGCRWGSDKAECKKKCDSDEEMVLTTDLFDGNCSLPGRKTLCCKRDHVKIPNLEGVHLASSSNLKGAETCGRMIQSADPCQFPFHYDGKVYYACTADGSKKGSLWCYTNQNNDSWRHCCAPATKKKDNKEGGFVGWLKNLFGDGGRLFSGSGDGDAMDHLFMSYSG